MKASELVIQIIENIAHYGDMDINVDLLTENKSNFVDINGNCIYFDKQNKIFNIECDINDLKEFKKNIK